MQERGTGSELLKALVLACAGAALAMSAAAQEAKVVLEGPDALAFSTENMDLTADPRVDFRRFAAGRWLDKAVRPENLATFGMATFIVERTKDRLIGLAEDLAGRWQDLPRGSPGQQVGAFYAAYMDTEARSAAGMAPLKDELDAIAAIGDFDDLARYLAHWARFTAGSVPLAILVPSPDLADNTRYALYALGGEFTLEGLYEDVYNDPAESPRRAAYRTLIAETLVVAGYEPARAAQMAANIDDLEVALHAGAPTPAEKVDPLNRYNPMTLAALQAQIPELDLTLFISELGIAVPENVNLFWPRYFPVLSAELKTRDMQEIRDYLSFRLISNFSEVLSPDFEAPAQAFEALMSGVAVPRPRSEKAIALIQASMGHPLGQVYVERYFSEADRQAAIEIINRVRAAFLARIPTRDWLTDATRAEALAKAEAMSFRVGYPERWIGYSGVPIGADPVANLIAIGTFNFDRMVLQSAGPVEVDPFNGKSTAPTVVNAAYQPAINGFEVPAAFLQSPIFQAGMDPAVRFCQLGATMGHEMTHGFDSQGRNYDATGRLRDWWTPQDAAAFGAEAGKLVEQANAYEVLPGLFIRGDQTIGENMADAGGLTFAFDALTAYLAEHPEEDVLIDGFTQAQRCFIAWTQVWTEKTTDQFTRNQVATNPHPPNNYRAVAAPRNVDAFYEAFGITEGDPMWLPREKRVSAW